MLKTFTVALLATAMSFALSFGLAEAKGHMPKQKAPPTCQTEAQAGATCACGPAKKLCQKGQWCHAFINACSQ
jgi:hypothetical protein